MSWLFFLGVYGCKVKPSEINFAFIYTTRCLFSVNWIYNCASWFQQAACSFETKTTWWLHYLLNGNFLIHQCWFVHWVKNIKAEREREESRISSKIHVWCVCVCVLLLSLVYHRKYWTSCHPSTKKMLVSAANTFWNNLLEPPGQKISELRPLFEHFSCPTEKRPYIATQLNSLWAKK